MMTGYHGDGGGKVGSLATTVAANLATTIAAISSCLHRIALSHRISLATVLAAVVTVLPPLLPLLFLQCCPRPGPCYHCCRHRCCRPTPVLATDNVAIPRCCRCVDPALATLAVILTPAALPTLSLTLPLKLIFWFIVMFPQIFWLIVMFPQPLTLSPLVALFCCR